MLAPSIERSTEEADVFGIAARDRYPSFLEELRDRTGQPVALNRLGILQVALTPQGVKGLKKGASPASRWLDREELARIEPALSHALGAVHNPLDGSVDNVALVAALETAVSRSSLITVRRGRISEVSENANGVTAISVDGETFSGAQFVVAAGAWSATVAGARLARAVRPVKGQLIEYAAAPLTHVAYGPRGYVVPRGSGSIGGSTTEDTGFESATSEDGISKVRAAAGEICPSLGQMEIARAWGGLRPVTPDGLPLLGAEPERPAVIYACGHGRNGILMAPLTGDIVADLVTGSPLPYDLEQFRPDRF
jgi:glycine oxidase